MARPRKLRYDPSLTVAEMMDKYNVSEATVRSYIQDNHIDRRYEHKQQLIKKCKKYLNKYPNATKKEVAEGTGISLSTVRRYWEYISTDQLLIDFDEKKALKNTNNSDFEVLSRIPVDVIYRYLASIGNVKPKYKKEDEVEVLKKELDAMRVEEKKNSQSLQILPPPTIETLTRVEEYDASKYLCCAFRKTGDVWKGRTITLGNMSGGFGYDIQGVHFHNSEAAYICGMFSDNVPEQIEVQKQLIANTNGKLVKGDIRFHNQDKARKDWYDFNVQWMLYVVWQKIMGNEAFRKQLMAIPNDAIIIEDVSFKDKMKENDTSEFWGARNDSRKEYGDKVKKYIEAIKANETDGAKDKLVISFINKFRDYGIYNGCNVMGKILTICRRCLQDGTEPNIDYELLKSKNIHLLGEPVEFGK